MTSVHYCVTKDTKAFQKEREIVDTTDYSIALFVSDICFMSSGCRKNLLGVVSKDALLCKLDINIQL